MSKRPATTSLTTPQGKKSRQAITLEQKIKVLEALQRGNDAPSKDVKDIMKLVKKVRGDSGFQEIQEEEVTELLVRMEDPLTSEEVWEMVEMAKKHKEEEEATDKPQTVGKELTIHKPR
ncbi:hypothetical protein Hamer_G005425, partial [Homarus americanus]